MDTLQASPELLQELRVFAKEALGLNLRTDQSDMLLSRILQRVRKLGMDDIESYIETLREPNSPELPYFVGVITTHVTRFMREPHHFTYLREVMLPELIEARATTRRLRIWSAGCSSGEEPYSIAANVREALPHEAAWDIRILATDIDPECILKGHNGVYESLGTDPECQRLTRWFEPADGGVRARDALREMITFKRLNFMDRWPMSGPFDVIFCRNVVIYFDQATQSQIFNRFADLMEPGGLLCVGHSESLHGLCDRFDLVKQSMYRKIR